MMMMMSTELLLCGVLTALIVGSATAANTGSEAETALEYVERVRSSPCTGGTEEVLPVQFDHKIWYEYAEVAVRMANLLTKKLLRNNNKFAASDERFLFDLVRNNVDSDSILFGSAIAVESYVFPKYEFTCPYAYKKDKVYCHDLYLNYNYQDPNTEWYAVLKNKNWANALVSENMVTYRASSRSHGSEQTLSQPLAQQHDGHWTLPYYDCGGGDIWMVTYSAPIFGWDAGKQQPMFRGIGTIDIELTNIDINQCDLDDQQEEDDTTKSVDVFRGTHRCMPSTKCVAETGHGFIPGAYHCVCQDGFYFPNKTAKDKYYVGSTLEQLVKQNSSDLSSYECSQCAPGCDTCVDDSPCLYSHKLAVRIALLLLSAACFVMVLCASLMVYIKRERKVIKSASPIFLHLMNAGAALMCTMMFITFMEPDEMSIICTLKDWPQHLGFTFAYGALLIKTWRISAIFKVKSAKKLNLTDKVLLRRFLPIPGIALLYMIAWTALGRSEVIWRKTTDTLKYKDCKTGWWSYGAFIVEVCLLLWGAVLCFIVRKAPSLFNESKYITWAIYNNIILGTFILIIRELIAKAHGPDVLYIVDFAYIQISVTGLLCLIYIPKLVSLWYNKDEDVVVARGVVSQQGTVATVNTGVPEDGFVDSGCQTDISGDILSSIDM